MTGKATMHDGEVEIGPELVGGLVAAQFPQLAGLPIREVRSTGDGERHLPARRRHP